MLQIAMIIYCQQQISRAVFVFLEIINLIETISSSWLEKKAL